MTSIKSATKDSVKQRLRFDDSDDVVEFNSHESPLHINKSFSNGKTGVTSEVEETSVRPLIGFCIFLVTISCLLISFVPPTLFNAIGIAVEDREGELYLTWKESKHIYIIGLLLCLGKSLLLALGCLGLSWNIIYYDSLEPGKNPPSPASPTKYREKSGHTFHMGYTMCIVNSVAVFFYVLYWLRDTYT